LNFLAAWDAWRAIPAAAAAALHLGRERALSLRGPRRGARAFAELAALRARAVHAWPPPLAGFHRLHFDGGNVILTLLSARAHADAAAARGERRCVLPRRLRAGENPGIWSPEVVRELARLAAPGATLATWTVAGGVRAALADAGFAVEKRTGFAPSARCSVGRCDRARGRRACGAAAAASIGGGLAGTLAAERSPRAAGTWSWSMRARGAAPRRSGWCAPSPTCAMR
jgi:tRNA 5-methylaminomethyl-2-thiouridine biosynthesis bifunctional protein